MRALFLVLIVWAAAPANAFAQSDALQRYLGPVLAQDAEALATAAPEARETAAIRNLLPHRHSNGFVEFVNEIGVPRFGDLMDAVDALRLNKMVANAPGVGGTALVSRVAVPAVIGAAIEYGSILQQTTGTTTTLRGNALGITRMLLGAEQFPYCPEIASGECTGLVRHLRNVSGTVGFESVRDPAEAPAGEPTPAQLAGDEFRVASLGVRLDLTPSNNLDDPKYVQAWAAAIAQLRTHPAAAALSAAVIDAFAGPEGGVHPIYQPWMAETTQLLKEAPAASFYDVLESRLVLLANRMTESDPDFSRNRAALRRAYANYFEVRDALIREAHVHKASLEYTNHRPPGQPATSNVRFIYSHQPTAAPAVVTLNTAATLYHEVPAGSSARTLRDVQLAAQLDRRLRIIPQFGQAVLTIGAYYQWLAEDALVTAPQGAAVVLPATKGHIGVLQGKVAIPLSDVVKVPVSITWASRRELIKEKDIRGQIGLTLDLDSLFR